jgi:hypothetical protein
MGDPGAVEAVARLALLVGPDRLEGALVVKGTVIVTSERSGSANSGRVRKRLMAEKM